MHEEQRVPATDHSTERWARFSRSVDLVLLGLLLAGALWLRITIANHGVPEPAFAFGPDGDDWAGVFLGAAEGWPLRWDDEWSYKYPLLPLLAWGVGRLTDTPLPCAALWICILAGSAVGPLTYLLGRPLVGRPAALAAGGWMVVQDTLASHSALTTAYALMPALYLVLLLGLMDTLRGRWRRGGALALGATCLLTVSMLHGLILALLTGVAAAGVLALGLLRPPRRWWGLLQVSLPCAAGLVLGRLWLLDHRTGIETPWTGAIRHLYEEVMQTFFHDPRYGVPTGHKVDRLVDGVSRWEHLAWAQWELFNLPLVAMGVLVLAGVVAVLLLMRRGEAGPRLLLLGMLAGVIYGFVANSEDFHVFQWYPALALVVGAGLAAWGELWPRWPVRLACWVGASALLSWQLLLVPAQPRLDPRVRYQRIHQYYDENIVMRRHCSALVGPVSLRGSLVVDHPHIWGYRALLAGADGLVRQNPQDQRPVPLSTLPRPVYIVTDGEPTQGDAPTNAPARWEPLFNLGRPLDVTLYRLVEPVEHH